MNEKTEKPDIKEPLAAFRERILSNLIDYAIFYGIIIIASIIIGVFPMIFVSTGIYFFLWFGYLLAILLYLADLVLAFFIFVWRPYKKDGQTIGDNKMKIKMMFIADEAKWTLRPVQQGDLLQILLRAIVYSIELSFIPILIVWYSITNDKNCQSFTDRLFKTAYIMAEEIPAKK